MTKQRVALITGISGMAGSHMADFLLSIGYKVYGLIRRTSTVSTWRIEHILDKITLLEGDLIDQSSMNRSVLESQPDEIYNFAAQSFVPTSWKEPELTAQVTGLGALRMLEAIRQYKPDAKYFQASSSEMFGSSPPPQSETTPFNPRSPYAVAKIFAHYLTINYRESFGIFGVCGIFFNQEGERRGMEFVTRKIANAVARIYYSKQKTLVLGDLSPTRDWGYSPEYVTYMWKMMQMDKPSVYAIGTGETHSIREFVDTAFRVVGLDYHEYVEYNQSFSRPAEVISLQADNTKARNELGLKITVPFEEIVNRMVKAELEREK